VFKRVQFKGGLLGILLDGRLGERETLPAKIDTEEAVVRRSGREEKS
jgi:hypothetical protein